MNIDQQHENEGIDVEIDDASYVDTAPSKEAAVEPFRELVPDELIDDITLSMVDGVGSLTTQRLFERFDTAGAVLSASRNELQEVQGLGPVLAERIDKARETVYPQGLVELCRRERIAIISVRDSRYPESLRTIDDPPQLLYVRGEMTPEDAFGIAVVGTRQMSSYGRRMTERLTTQLAHAGFTIISGLAIGIDGVAHQAALSAGARTLAVLGSGLLKLYPSKHEEIARRIAGQGAVLSEYHPLMPPNKGTFPQRNRIVSGLSLGVLVVEAPEKSGAMITARLAAEQGRELFAMVGPSDSSNSRGCHQLIRDGAILVERCEDIIEALGPMPNRIKLAEHPDPIRHPNELTLSDIEKTVLKHIGEKATSLETVVRDSGLELRQVSTALWVLEDRRIVRRIDENNVARM